MEDSSMHIKLEESQSKCLSFFFLSVNNVSCCLGLHHPAGQAIGS